MELLPLSFQFLNIDALVASLDGGGTGIRTLEGY